MDMRCNKKVIIACSALRVQLENTLADMKVQAQTTYLEAGLHLRPQLLKEELIKAITLAYGQGAETKIVYGNCCPEIDQVCNRYGARRINAENCYQLYLGDLYSNLIREQPGTYFLDHFLAENFENLVVKQLGMARHPKLKSILFKHYKRLIYIDVSGSGLTPEARSIADYLALPIEAVEGDARRFQLLFSEIL
jgi:hypothetical protein